jgi:Ca2+-transporting ATPase
VLPLEQSDRNAVEKANSAMAARGMRVLAVGFRAAPGEGFAAAAAPTAAAKAAAPAPAAAASAPGGGAVPADQDLWERDLVLVGLIGMIDPAREEAREAVLTASRAGIRPVMITGDQPLTAAAIARQVGILSDEERSADEERTGGAAAADAGGAAAADAGGADPAAPDAGKILTGTELAALSVEQLSTTVDDISVFARVAPEQKLNIVQALQERGHIVAMTGDGVNDAPALQKADIGVAMGITGTDVAKEAADMVLMDDNFATIVAAVREGRVIYDNIRKFIKYLMATNVGELTVMLLAPLFGMPLPLLPLQILWMNLVTDGLPGLALGFEPAETNVMDRPPNRPNESIFARGLGTHIMWAGPLMGIIALVTGWLYWEAGDEAWQTMVFTVLTLSQMGHVLAIRQERESLFRAGLLSNRLLFGAVVLTVLLQFALVYVPFLQDIFGTQNLDATHILIAVALSTVIFWVIEIQKWALRAWERREKGGAGGRA